MLNPPNIKPNLSSRNSTRRKAGHPSGMTLKYMINITSVEPLKPVLSHHPLPFLPARSTPPANPKDTSMSTLWRLTAHADFKTLAETVERLDERSPPLALSWSLFDDGDGAKLDVLFQTQPDEAAFRKASGMSDDIAAEIAPLPDEDWVRLSLAGLKPVEAGRFTLFGAHDRDAVAEGQIGIEIEAGPAFGTGHHGTTRGCLMAFDEMLTAGLRPAHILDLGCGTAALAIGAAKALPDAIVWASDIDPEAITESEENCRKNNISGVECFVAEGLEHPRLADAQFELVFANILAGPLVELAPGIANIIAPGGRVILSGLLTEQEDMVRKPYEAQGLVVTRQTPIKGWETLVAVKPG